MKYCIGIIGIKEVNKERILDAFNRYMSNDQRKDVTFKLIDGFNFNSKILNVIVAVFSNDNENSYKMYDYWVRHEDYDTLDKLVIVKIINEKPTYELDEAVNKFIFTFNNNRTNKVNEYNETINIYDSVNKIIMKECMYLYYE